MAFEQVQAFLKANGLEGRVHEFDSSSATVALAAAALGTEPERIAKTLSFANGETCILIVAAGDAKIDNRKFKDLFGRKASMLPPEEVLRLTGHAVGGVCPFALPEGTAEVYTDISLQRFETVFPAAGSSNSAVELACDALFTLSASRGWVDVCKGWQKENT